MKLHRILTPIIGALLSGFAFADIRYDAVYDATNSRLILKVSVPVKADVTSVQIPNWAPGSYVLANYRERIRDMAATDSGGKSLELTRPDENTWSVDSKGAKSVTFSYNVNMAMVDNVVHYSGPATYVYVVGRKEEKCILTLSPPGSGMIAIGLSKYGKEKNVFAAQNYDVLADNPVTMGDFVLDSYKVNGKMHYVAYRGIGTKYVDREEVIRNLEFLTKAQIDFFKGQAPYDHYVWHFSVNDAPDGAGGLEHLSSTQISMGAGNGPRVVHVQSHEFFHLWNVKRIRSLPLGPFDYLELPKTGALWWLEGVTDYYSALIPTRYGYWDEQTFRGDLLSNYDSAMKTSGRTQISIYDASYRVGEANNGRGNSNGLFISYYTFGWLAGMCLDIEIREKTAGRYSLDNVMWDLWNECKNDKPGFKEDRIRTLCIKYGGESLGAFFDRVVMTPGDPPIPEQLAKVGLKIDNVTEVYVDRGFEWTPSRNDSGARITATRANAESSVSRGDIIVAVEGVNVTDESTARIYNKTTKALEAVQAGKPIRMTIKRDGTTKDVLVTPVNAERTVRRIVESSDATNAQRNLRTGWIYAGKKKIPLSPIRK